MGVQSVRGDVMRYLSQGIHALHALTYYLMGRGVLVACSLAASAIAIALFGRDPWLAGVYVGYLEAYIPVVFGAALIGPLLLEDVLRKTEG